MKKLLLALASVWSLLLVACEGFGVCPPPHHHPSNHHPSRLRASRDSNVNPTTHKDKKELTLYEILGASPDDTKAELKRKYVALAKQTHPDAIAGATSTTATAASQRRPTDLEFTDIAAAYKLLSDPKERRRYDRKLQAERVSRELSEWSSGIAEKAAPQVRDLLDNMAVPFLRRTTATTLATVQAAAKEIRKEELQKKNNDKSNTTNTTKGATTESPDLGSVFTSAMKAAHKAGQLVDNIELLEKSEGLESQVLKQIEQANQIKAKLDKTTMRRVMTALRTPNATFSAADAAQVWSLWNITSTTFLERAKLKNPVDRKIQELESAEELLGDKELELEAAMRMYQTAERKLQKARADRVLALQAEKRAREALARAKRNVAASKTQVNNTTKQLQQAELVYEKIALERDKLAQALAKQQEDVRKSVLSRKEVTSGVLKDDEEVPTLTDLEQLEQEEAELIAEYSRLEVTASQLQDKANRLRAKAEKLNNTQG